MLNTTRRFNMLSGLRIIPLGLFVISLAIWRIWLQHGLFSSGLPASETFVFLILMEAILLGLAVLINHYYQRILAPFGTLELDPEESRHQRSTLLLLFFIYLVGTSVDSQELFPISVFGLAVGASLFFYWWLPGHRQIYYLISALLVVILSLLPLFFPTMHSPFFFNGADQYWNIVQPVIGFTLILCGIGDHLLLLKALKVAKMQ